MRTKDGHKTYPTGRPQEYDSEVFKSRITLYILSVFFITPVCDEEDTFSKGQNFILKPLIVQGFMKVNRQ